MPVYDSIGQSYSKFRLPDPRIVDSLVNLLQLEPGSSIADIGAGTGNYSRASADRGYFLYAVEPSSVMREPQTKLAYAGYQNLDFPLVRAGGLRFYSPRIPF